MTGHTASGAMVSKWLQTQSAALNIEDEICVSTVIDNAKALYRQA